jgi:4-hydroxy-tetrahydrodipicolinate synthase
MFNGSIVALVTPFNQSGEIDFPALQKLVDFHLDNGTKGLVIAGTTGESVNLTPAEFCAMLDRVVEQVGGRMPVIAGTGSASTVRAIEQTRLAVNHGADAVLVVTPYYNRPVQSGLEAHYRAVADASDAPVILYNVPGRTGVDLKPETVQRLAGHERIVAIKEAVAGVQRIDELRERCGEAFCILSGDDHSCLEAMKHGARGVISVAANVIPADMAALCAAAAEQRWSEADAINRRLVSMFDILTVESNPIPVKWAAFEMNLIGPQIRLPMTMLGEAFREPLRQCLRGYGLLPA